MTEETCVLTDKVNGENNNSTKSKELQKKQMEAIRVDATFGFKLRYNSVTN